MLGPLLSFEVDIGRSPLTEPEISFPSHLFFPTPNRVVFIFGMNHFQSIQNVVAAFFEGRRRHHSDESIAFIAQDI